MASKAFACAAALVSIASCALLWACGDRPALLDAEPQTDTGVTAAKAARAFYVAAKNRIPTELATNPGTPHDDYVGSRSCEKCHEKAYADWRQSFHSRTLYDAVPATVFGDFSGDFVYSNPRYAFRARAFRDKDRFFVQVTNNPKWVPPPPEKVPAGTDPRDTYGGGIPTIPTGIFELIYSFGNRRHQPYVMREANGRYWVPPIFWNDVKKTWMWCGYRPYVATCAQCHVTGIVALDRADAGSFRLDATTPQKWTPSPDRESWAEGAVGCEVCHGPGKPHVDRAKSLGDVAFKKLLADGGSSFIYCPSRDTPEIRMKQCDACHLFGMESSVTWVPNPSGYDHKMIGHPLRQDEQPGQFYEDGTDQSPCTVGHVFRDSKMGKSGQVECMSCHDPHGNSSFGSLVKPLAGNQLCLTCHSDKYGTKEQLVAHTHHKFDSPGSSCLECHMPRDKRFTNGQEGDAGMVMSAQIPSHSFSIPTGDARKGGPEPSCNTCHTDRSYLWTFKKIQELWAKPPTAPAAPAAPMGK